MRWVRSQNGSMRKVWHLEPRSVYIVCCAASGHRPVRGGQLTIQNASGVVCGPVPFLLGGEVQLWVR